MYKRVAGVLFALGLVLLLTVPAMAAANGEIRIMPHRAGKSVSGGSVMVSRVGAVADDGYLIIGHTQNWLIPADELYFPETAAWIQKNAKAKGITKTVDDTGIASFTGLDAGLYLVTQPSAASGYVPFQPFLIELPLSGKVWQADAYPKAEKILTDNPQTGDHPAPIIAAMVLVLSVAALLFISDKHKQ